MYWKSDAKLSLNAIFIDLCLVGKVLVMVTEATLVLTAAVALALIAGDINTNNK